MASSGRPLGSMIVELDMTSTKFENSLKSIQNQFRLAKSEMKANLSVLDTTGTSYEKASAKVDELSKLMEVNEKQISVLKDRYDTAVKTNGEYSDSALKVANQLNKAEAQQAQYQRQLDNAKVTLKDAERGTDSYREALQRVQKQAKIEVDSLQAQGRGTEANLVQYKSLGKEVDNYSKIIASERSKLQDLIITKGEDTKETQDQKEKIAELSAVQEKAKYQYSELGKNVKNLSSDQAQSIDKMDKLSGKFNSVGSSIRGVGTTMTLGFTAPVVAGLGLATKSASSYQYQLQDVRKEVEAQGYSTSQVNKIMSNLSNEVITWSKKFGVGTREINDGLFELVSNGYNVKQAVGMMPELLKTMTANSDKSGLSIKLTSSMLEQFGLNLGSNKTVISNSNQLMNEMTEATHKTAMNLGDLQEVSGNAGAAMHAMGVSTNDFMAVAGKLKSAGIDASSVGTGLSSMMTRLGTGTGAAADDLKKYNIQVFDSHHKMKPMLDIIGQMQKAYKGMNGEEQQKFMYDTVGQENMKVGMTLMDANLGKYQNLSNEIKNSSGTVDKYNNTMKKTNEFASQKFKSSIEGLSIAFGQQLLPILTPVINKITGLLNSFGKLSPSMKKTITVSALVAATLGPLLMIIGQISLGVSGLMSAFTGIKTVMAGTKLAGFLAPLGALAGPIAITVAAIAALGIAFTVAYKKIKPFRDWVNGLVKDIKTKVKDVTTVIKSVFTLFTSKSGSKNSNAATDMLSKILPKQTVKNITASVSTVKNVIKGFFDFLKSVGSGNNGQSFFSKFLPKPLVNLIVGNIKNIKKNFSDMGNSIKSVFSSLGKTIGPILTKIGSLFGSVISKIVSIWNEKGSGLKQSFKVIFGFIATIVSTQMNVISTVINLVMGAISTEIKAALDLIKNVFSAVFNSLKDIVSGALDIIKGVFEVFAGIFTGNWKEVWNGVKDIFSGIWKSFKGIVGGVLNTIIGLVNTGIDGINWLTSKFGVSKIGHISPVKFARGSTNQYPNGLPNNQIATVNDGGKKEIVVTPNGNAFVPGGWNTTMLLMKGSHVISGDDSEPILNATGNHYANGSGLLSGFGKAVGDIGNSIKNGAESAMDWVKDSVESATRFLKDPLNNLIKSFTSNIKFDGATQFVIDDTVGKGKYIAKSIKDNVVKEIKKWKDDKVDAEAVSGEPQAAKAWLPIVKKLMSEMGAKPPKGIDWEAAAFVREIARESGGNPTVRQAISDKNSLAGNPAMGLLQFIPQTFMSYAVPGHKNILSGEDQIRATINAYMHSGAWGRIGTGKQINFLANGGYFDIPTPAVIGEAGPEVVLPLTNKTRAMNILSQAQAVMGNGNVSSSNNVDTSMLEENQKQQTLLMQIQNKLLSKILEIITNGNGGSDDSNALNRIYKAMDQLGLKDRKITKYQMR